MAADEDENIDDFKCMFARMGSSVAPSRKNFRLSLQTWKVPSRWKDKGYRLQQKHGTYKYRCQLFKNFIDKKKSEGFSLTSTCI